MANLLYGDLYLEKWLRDEVIYLHGLWNEGPDPSPTGNSNTNTNRNPTLTHLRPRSSVKISKYRKPHSRRKKAVASEKEWPCDPAPDPDHTAWPEPPPKPAQRPPCAEALAAALAASAQNKGVEVCKRFFCKKDIDGDSEEGDLEEEEEEEEEEDVEVKEEVEERAFKLFMEVFTEDSELRGYYEANREKGEFLCLVCEGSGAKKGRKYGDCVGLVQHCSNVAKTGRRAAHRGLARALCRVIGWNFGRLPMFVLDVEETLGQRLARYASRQQEKRQEAEQIQNEAVE